MKATDVNPELIMMIGAPGTGKSTWRKDFMSKDSRDWVIVSSDDEIEAMLKPGETYSSNFQQYIKPASQKAESKFDQAIKKGANVILDRTNMSRKARRSWLQKLPKHYTRTAVVFSMDRDELQRSLDARAEKTGKTIPSDVVDNMLRSYEEPDHVEFDRVEKIHRKL